MYTSIEKPKSVNSRTFVDFVSQKRSRGKQIIKDNRLQTHQRLVLTKSMPVQFNQIIQREPDDIGMSSSKQALKASFDRKIIADRIYKYLSVYESFRITSLVETKSYLKTSYKGSYFNKFQDAEDEEQTAICKEILARKYHDDTASEEITPEMRSKLGRGEALSEDDENSDGPDILASTVLHPDKSKGRKDFDIKSNMTQGKACVITALMFSEGGGVLGAGSVEELHFILSTRFKTTWRHYSDEKVYKSLYEHLGYTKSVPGSATSLQNLSTLIGSKTFGMVSIGGHMIGFKKDSSDYFLRDNDEGMKKTSNHSRKIETITEIWTK